MDKTKHLKCPRCKIFGAKRGFDVNNQHCRCGWWRDIEEKLKLMAAQEAEEQYYRHDRKKGYFDFWAAKDSNLKNLRTSYKANTRLGVEAALQSIKKLNRELDEY